MIQFLPKGKYLTKKCILPKRFKRIYNAVRNKQITHHFKESEETKMNKNWAYGFALNHEGAGVGTIYYAAKYFEQENITNPASAEAYTTEEINEIKANAEKGEAGYSYDVPEGAVIGMNVLNTDKVFWYDEDNSAKITACANPLGLDKATGEMKDMDGNVVASAM